MEIKRKPQAGLARHRGRPHGGVGLERWRLERRGAEQCGYVTSSDEIFLNWDTAGNSPVASQQNLLAKMAIDR